MKTMFFAAAALLAAGSATAQVDEVRVGVMQHNICVLDCDNADKEDGPNVQAEVVFTSPQFLNWAFSPRPYLMASANTAGKTSFAGGGLQWDFKLIDRVSFEPGLGYVFHDGTNENPFPQGDPQGAAFAEEKCVVIFPSGRLAMKQEGRMIEKDWFPTVVGLARKQNAPVIPLNLDARNSALYYLFCDLSNELRDITLFNELLNKRGSKFRMTFGETIPPEHLAGDPVPLTESLKRHVSYALLEDRDARFRPA